MIYFFCFVQHQGLHALELLKMLQLPKPAYEINFGGHYFPTMLGIFFFFFFKGHYVFSVGQKIFIGPPLGAE